MALVAHGGIGPGNAGAAGLDAVSLSDLPDLRGIVGDRAYRRFARLADRKHVQLEVKAPPKGMSGLTQLLPLYKIEHAIAQLGRWRRLSRCYEGSEASARAWLEAACVGYLAWRGPGSSSANRLAYPSSISRSTAPAANSATGPEPRNPIRTTRATTSGDERS